MQLFRFRWVYCQLQTLRRCFPPSIRSLLDELPITLDETYERILMEIPEEKWRHAHRLFRCLIASFRPLRVEELAEVLAIRFDSDTTADLVTGWRPEDTEDAILSACSSLVTVVKIDGSPIVQFAHFSVKEYLTSNRLTMAKASVLRYHIPAEPAHLPAHLILAQACLSTLLELDEHIHKDRLKNYPLVFYAAQYWVDHVQIGDTSLSILDRMEQLFDADKPHFSAWIWLYDVNHSWRIASMEDISERPSEPVATPLYYSAACGLRSLVERLVATHPKDVNPREGSIWAPLRVAIEKRQLNVARLLLEHGAYPDIKGTNGWTLLHEASYGWDIGALQLLLEHGADVDCRNSRDQTPLHLSSDVGSLEAMQLLVVYGADVNKRIPNGWTPLHRAVRNRSVEAVRLLLQCGANVNEEDENGWTALHFVSDRFGGSLEIALALLDCGADMHARTNSDMTPLEMALNNGHHDIVQLLLSMM